jgi:hypothetical protein
LWAIRRTHCRITNVPIRNVVASNAPTKTQPKPPEIRRTRGAGTLDLDQLAAVLARILES